MAFAERAELVARLSLKDDFTGRMKAATGSLRGMEGSLGRIAGHAQRGLGNAAANLGKIGVIAGGFVALNVRQGINSLAELEDATTSVDGAIKQLGLTGRLTAQQVAAWANEIESSVDAAFDDKQITQATTNLLRFGKVAPENLRATMVVMTDLAAKTGDVSGAGEMLGKALAAPEKAAGKLARQGIYLTDVQQDMIEKFVEAGDKAGAQAFLLGELEKSTKGAAAAMHGPYRDALNTMRDATEDAQRALGEAFLPLLQRVAGELKTAVADPKVMAQIREFGKTMAGGFDKLLSIGKQIPWQQIGDSMKIAGAGAKAVFDVFTSMPPWVQTAVLTGWGLNKLTGGALGSIVGELGKGLIKGVFGMTAGVVHLKAGTVVGGAPGGGVVPVGGPAGGRFGGLLNVVSKVFMVGMAAEVASLIAKPVQQLGSDLGEQIPFLLKERQELGQAIFGPQKGQGVLSVRVVGVKGDVTPWTGPPPKRELRRYQRTSEDRKANVDWRQFKEPINKLERKTDRLRAASDRIATNVEKTKAAINWKVGAVKQSTDRVTTGVERTKAAIDWKVGSVKTAVDGAKGVTQSGTNAIVAAINRNRPIITVTVQGSTYNITQPGTVNRTFTPDPTGTRD